MHPPILRCLVPGARRAVGPLAEPGEIAPGPSLLAIETLTTYLRSVDPRRENGRTWNDFVVDHQISDSSLRRHCEKILKIGREMFARKRREIEEAGRPVGRLPNEFPEQPDHVFAAKTFDRQFLLVSTHGGPTSRLTTQTTPRP